MVSKKLRQVNLREKLSKVVKSKQYRRGVSLIQKKPFTSFFIALGLFLLILIVGSVMSSLGQKEKQKITPVKIVKTYTIGKTPTVTLQAQVKENGLVQIIAQTAGIVDTIHVSEGDTVRDGQWLMSLATNYQGGNAPALQAQLAGAVLKNNKESYDTQKEIIAKQKEITTTTSDNTEQLRQISIKSLQDTRNLISLNEEALDSLVGQIDTVKANNPDDPMLTGLLTQKLQIQSGLDQLQAAERSYDYQTNDTNPPTTLSNTQKDIALKQLDLQEKALDLNKKVSGIQYNLALVQEGVMHPSAPFAGTVARIHVQVGQNVSSGDVVATVVSSDVNTSAILRVPAQIAHSVSHVEPSIFTIKNKKYSVVPSYVSTVATDGQLYSIIYNFPDGSSIGTDGEYISVVVPVGYAQTSGITTFVPIDSVYESQNDSTLYLLKDKKALARKVTLGDVYGEYVEVTQGLHDDDIVILDRNVVAGDTVTSVQ